MKRQPEPTDPGISVACSLALCLVVGGCAANNPSDDRPSGQGGQGPGGATNHASGGAARGGGSSSAVPATDSQLDIVTFVESRRYAEPPWLADVAAPRGPGLGTQHDGPVRVWLSPVLIDALKNGRDGRQGREFPNAGSMAVKELFDSSNALVGIAASLKTADGNAPSSWTYYCYGPDTRCGYAATPKESPIYSKGSILPGSNCGICHGYSVFTAPPP